METLSSYTDEQQQLVISSAIKKKEEKLYAIKVSEKHFSLRNNCIQRYFLRLSADHKRELILRYVDRLNNPASLYQIFSVMSLAHSKMDVYAIVDPETNFLLDKLILDHDRTLEGKILQETVDKDLDWFGTLDDYLQINLVLHLIRLSGGNVKRNLYIPLYRIYRKTLCELSKKHFGSYASGKSLCVLEEPKQDDPEVYDPALPASVEVEKQRKRWYDLIFKYREEILRPAPSKGDKKKKGKKSPKEEKVEKGEKKKKGKKSTKEEKMGKGGKKNKKTKDKKKGNRFVDDVGAFKQIDLIQLLPVWIVKKIFTHFDTKTLTKLKKVNSYWSFVITELIKERKVRQKLDATLEKIFDSMDPEVAKKIDETPTDRRYRPKEKKIFYELGAIDEKLVPKKLKGLVETSLVTRAMKTRVEEFDTVTGEWVHFPRFIKEDLELYRFKPGVLHDIGVEFDVLKDVEKQKSVLTYSLSQSVESLKISVPSEILADW